MASSISTFTDPNIYLKLDPIKSIQSNIARKVDYEHIIITRFSYRFKADMPIGNLFDDKRMLRRFQLFESFCLPSVLSQINPNFYWIIIVDNEIPVRYLDILWKTIAKFYASNTYSQRGPRQIFVHRWDWTSQLSDIEWIKKLVPLTRKYLITTRLDDDDGISRDFTNTVAQYLHDNKVKGFKLISFSHGYYWYSQPSLTYGIFKLTNKPWIAIGLSFITERDKYPMTVYFGNHTKLTQYIRNWKGHKLLKHYIELNKENIDAKTCLEKYEVVRRVRPIYIRTVHDHNLQKNEKNEYLNKGANAFALKRASIHNLNILSQYFTINQTALENINSKI